MVEYQVDSSGQTIMPSPWEKEEFNAALEWERKAREGLLKPIPCISGWMDICGFGSRLESAAWDLQKLQTSGMVNILSEAYSRVGHPLWTGVSPAPHEIILVLNDGIARTVDLLHPEYTDAVQAIFYVRNIVLAHLNLLRLTHKSKLGVRTVIAGGERIQFSPTQFTGNMILHHEYPPSKIGKKLLDQNFLYNPAEIQMNTAFAKAYTIDSKGSKYGFTINGLFLEESFFDKISIIEGLEIDIGESSILMTRSQLSDLRLSIKETIDFNYLGLQTKIYSIDAVTVGTLESEETFIDLVNFGI